MTPPMESPEERFDIEAYRPLNFEGFRLAIAATLSLTREHGPGNRFSIWTQGCLKRCPGCINQSMLEAETANDHLMDPEQLLFQVRQARDSVAQVHGVTLQGGEPMLQAEGLSRVLGVLKEEDPDFNLITFTGYRLETLQKIGSPGINALLNLTDTLIDGLFEAEKRDHQSIRGSSNQRVIHLTSKLRHADFGRRGPAMGILLGSSPGRYITGTR